MKSLTTSTSIKDVRKLAVRYKIKAFTETEIRKTIAKSLTMSDDEALEILMSPACTKFEKIIFKIIENIHARGNVSMLKKLLELAYGKKRLEIDINQNVMTRRVKDITPVEGVGAVEASKIYQKIMSDL